jgi:SAM-dependent methyltransferase
VPLRRRMVGELHVTEDEAVALAVECLHVVNVVDTAAVREGLLDDALLAGLEEIRDWLVAKGQDDGTIVEERGLVDRLVRLRGGRDREGVELAVAALSARDADQLAHDLATCQLWYCEAATGQLRPDAQLRVLAAACAEARRLGIDTSRAWHAQLEPLITPLASRYRRRLVEADAPALIAATATALDQDPGVSIALRESEEATALLTLLAIYETKASAAFHATLKALCDLYGLRKDEFDRVANEAEYLASMNAARDDKARMLELVRPGTIVEVGPGGGVVLDLLEDRFPDSEIIGLEVSSEVVAALAQRRNRDKRRWRVVEADAFALADHVGAETVDTVVFCSVLHEIYSYGGFRLERVRDLLRAAWRALVPGGRIVIRDGVAPPPGTRRIRFLADDARAFFDLFAAQFEGFAITWRDLPDGRVELPSHHAMEFLYTYTWGPASFPYEVREQYGILTYDAYRAALFEWLDGAQLVPLPADLASYLQPGYIAALAPKIALTDEHDHPARWPDSNCVIVIEKSS